MVRTIVCAFEREAQVPAAWFQVHRRFEHAIAKNGLKIRLRMDAIEDLPPAYDLLVVPPELRETAEQLAGDAFVFVTTREAVAGAVDTFMKELARGDVLTAEKADPNAPKIVTHRGMEII